MALRLSVIPNPQVCPQATLPRRANSNASALTMVLQAVAAVATTVAAVVVASEVVAMAVAEGVVSGGVAVDVDVAAVVVVAADAVVVKPHSRGRRTQPQRQLTRVGRASPCR
jgi:hypothetical protein